MEIELAEERRLVGVHKEMARDAEARMENIIRQNQALQSKVAEENDGIEFGDLFARAIAQKIADYGGGAGIEKTYAAGCRRMRIVVFTEGSTPKERIDVTLP